MTDIVSALAFVGFALTGLALGLRRRGGGPDRERLASALIAYAVIVSVGVGVTQRSLWPFAPWNLMTGPGPRRLLTGADWHPARIVGITPDGREHRIDYRTWQPFSYEELVDVWLPYRLPHLSGVARRRVGSWLLERANAARRNVLEGREPGTWSRILGPITAPTHFMHRRRWRDPGDVPTVPFERIRLYLEYFDVEIRARDPAQVRLVPVYEYPE